jgi:hypothetical protein
VSMAHTAEAWIPVVRRPFARVTRDALSDVNFYDRVSTTIFTFAKLLLITVATYKYRLPVVGNDADPLGLHPIY